MNAELNADDDTTEITIAFDGAVRTLAEQEAGAAFTGDEDAEAALNRYSTRVAVRSANECRAVRAILGRLYDGDELQANQRRAVRRVRGKLAEAAAEFRSIEAAEDDEDEVVADGGKPLTAETEDEAEDLVETLEAGDRVEVTRHGSTETYRVTSTGDGRFTGKRTDAHKAGTTTFVPTCVRNYALATHGRGMSSRFGRVEVVARSIEAHRPEDAETNDAMSESEAEDLLNRGVVVEDMDGDRVEVTVRDDTGGIHLTRENGFDACGAFDMGVEKLVTGAWTPLETVVGTLEDDGDEGEDGAASDRVVCTDGGRETEFVEGEFVDVQADDGEVYTAVVEDVEVEDEATTYWIEFEDEAPAYGAHCGTDLFVESCGTAYGTAEALERHGQGEELVADGGAAQSDEAEARRTQAMGDATLALDAAHAGDVDALTDPFTALDASATDVFAVEVDGRRVVTETFRVASDGSFTIDPVGGSGRIEGRSGEALDRIERVEWFGELVN